MSPLTARVLDLDAPREVARVGERLVEIVRHELRRRGVVVGLSGGVDSAVCAALAARALGPSRVFAVLLPDRESPASGVERARQVAEQLGIAWARQDITSVLEAVGCYRVRDETIASLVPGYGPGWRNKITIAGGMTGGLNFFRLVVEAPDGTVHRRRLPYAEFLQIVAAQNFKQRIRKTIEYFHADRLQYAVMGTPNRLEYDQGFFVKNGDGSADVKPIAHLYKTQVYALARHLDLPDVVITAAPSTDTFSLPMGQDEHFFGLPHEQMDLALWAHDHGVPEAALGEALGLDASRAALVYRDIEAKRRAAHYLHAAARFVAPPDAVPGDSGNREGDAVW